MLAGMLVVGSPLTAAHAAHGPPAPDPVQVTWTAPDLLDPERYVVLPPDVVWPVPTEGSRITDRFGPRAIPTAGASAYHLGVDFNPGYGVPVVSIADGTAVDPRGVLGDRTAALGNVAAIVSNVRGRYVVSIYAHLAGPPMVGPGQPVAKGQQIGSVGATGVATGPHLHFEMHDASNNAFDPIPFLMNRGR